MADNIINDLIEEKVAKIIALQFIVVGIKNVLVSGIPAVYAINNLLNIVIMGMVCVAYLYAIFLLRKRKMYFGITVVTILVCLSLLFTYMFYPENVVFFKEYELRFLVVLFPSCLLISKLHTLEPFHKYMYYGSFFITISTVIFAVSVQSIGHSIYNSYDKYSMSMANVAMLAIMWQLRAVLKEKDKKALLFLIVGTIVLILFGSRNQLLAIATYVLSHFLGKSKYKISICVTIAIVGWLLYVNLVDILTYILVFFDNFGLDSRTLSLILEGGIDESTQIRIDTHNKLWEIISRNPFEALGICGDEVHVGELSHSLYYSIWTTYGLILGSLLLLCFFRVLLKALKKSTGIEHQLLVMYICMVLPRSFTGGDVWGSDVFWVLLGICFMTLNTCKTKKYTHSLIEL